MLTSSASSRLQKIRAVDIAAGAGQRTAAQRAIDVDVAVGDNSAPGLTAAVTTRSAPRA